MPSIYIKVSIHQDDDFDFDGVERLFDALDDAVIEVFPLASTTISQKKPKQEDE